MSDMPPPTSPPSAPAAPDATGNGGNGKRRIKKRYIALGVFVLLVIVAAIGGTSYWMYARQFEETDDAFVDGTVVMVSPQVAGRVKSVYVEDNQDVAPGKVLVEIDPKDFLIRLEQAKAAVGSAEARLSAAQTNVDLIRSNDDAMLTQGKGGVEMAEAGVPQAEAAVTRAEAGVTAAEAQVASAGADVESAMAEASKRQADVKRYESVDPRATSQQQRDAARAAADAADAQLTATKKRQAAAEAQVTEARARVTEAKAGVAEAGSKVAQAQGVLQAAQTAPQQIAAAEAQVRNAQAALDEARAAQRQAEQQLSYTTILAPTGGRVTRKNVDPGQYVDAGQVVMTVVEPGVWVTANFKETQLTHMHQGQKVEIWVDTYPGRSFKGRVGSIQAGTGARFSLMPPENATGNYVKVVQRVPVKIYFDEDPATQQLLAPGMSAVPRVRIAGDEGAPGPIATTASRPGLARETGVGTGGQE